MRAHLEFRSTFLPPKMPEQASNLIVKLILFRKKEFSILVEEIRTSGLSSSQMLP
jgi:hypothetical protein